jgi:hypothetical protein
MKPNYMSIDDPFNTGGELESKLREMLEMHPSSSLCLPLFLKKIDFKKKVVSDMTSEATFSLKPIFLL